MNKPGSTPGFPLPSNLGPAMVLLLASVSSGKMQQCEDSIGEAAQSMKGDW